MQQPDAPGKGLRYPRMQSELLGTGKHEQAAASIGIDTLLQPGEQFRNTLRLVDYCPVRMALQEGAWIASRQFASVGGFEVYVGFPRKHRLDQSGLARLPRPGYGDDGVVGGQFGQQRLRVPGNHAASPVKFSCTLR